jgi:hypothetical protein
MIWDGDEYDRIGEEAVVAYFEVVYWPGVHPKGFKSPKEMFGLTGKCKSAYRFYNRTE